MPPSIDTPPNPHEEGQAIYCFGNDACVSDFHSLMESGLGLYGYKAIPDDYVQLMHRGQNFYSLPMPFPLDMKSIFAVAKALTYYDRSVVLGVTLLDNILCKFQVHACSGYLTKDFSLDVEDLFRRHSLEPPWDGFDGVYTEHLDIISSELLDLLRFSAEDLKKDASQR
jgi:hypothetical protein